MSLTEVEQRAAAIREAQVAISCLFLDTELAKGDLAALARVLKSTGLPPAELQRIYETEVAPACWRNLWAVPGGGVGWIRGGVADERDRAPSAADAAAEKPVSATAHPPVDRSHAGRVGEGDADLWGLNEL